MAYLPKLLPGQMLELYSRLKESLPADSLKGLDPSDFFQSSLITRKDARDYEQQLKARISTLLTTPSTSTPSPLHSGVIVALQHFRSSLQHVDINIGQDNDEEYLMSHIGDLYLGLRQQDLFPAIVFSLKKQLCEQLMTNLLSGLGRDVRKCTYTTTGDRAVDQIAWTCNTCALECCVPCKDKCHRGHDINGIYSLPK